MARFQFELAQPEDDEGLRAVLRETMMPGKIGLQFLREPSFFGGNCVLGDFHQTIVCRDQDNGEIIGFGCRSIRDMWADGRVQPIGYLSMLRLKTAYRSLGLLSRGYRYIRELHEDRLAQVYLTTIAEGNDHAMGLLTSGRAGLPHYVFQGNYSTFVLPCNRTKQIVAKSASSDFEIRSASVDDLDAILVFQESASRSRRCFPRYRRCDFFNDLQTFRNLKPEDILLAIDRTGGLAGTMGLWDQRAFRQTAVVSYQGSLNTFRPVYNVWAKATGQVVLPKPGSRLNYGFVAFPIVRDAETGLFLGMLERLLNRADELGMDYVVLGCHHSDPLWNILMRSASQRYETRIYQVQWDSPVSSNLKNTKFNNTYLELGCL